jgi:hypothetical protein
VAEVRDVFDLVRQEKTSATNLDPYSHNARMVHFQSASEVTDLDLSWIAAAGISDCCVCAGAVH